MRRLLPSLVVSACIAFVACGGGGGSSLTSPFSPPVTAAAPTTSIYSCTVQYPNNYCIPAVPAGRFASDTSYSCSVSTPNGNYGPFWAVTRTGGQPVPTFYTNTPAQQTLVGACTG